MSAGNFSRSRLAVAVAVTLALAPTDHRWAALSRALLALVQTLAWPVRVNAVRTGSARATSLVSQALDSIEALAFERIEAGTSVERARRVIDRVNEARGALDALSTMSARRAA
ncbi:MAG: hypothetical protein U0269_04285 [Polyangiales bacterium]